MEPHAAPHVDAALRAYSLPFNVYVPPSLRNVLARIAAEGLLPGAHLIDLDPERSVGMPGPAIVVFRPEDIGGSLRESWRRIVEGARPGRPVMYGGTGDRVVLMDAINVWRVFRVVNESPRPTLLADALIKAQEALELERGIEQAASELRQDTLDLERALEDLQRSQKQARHAERLATLGRITKSLVPVLTAHLGDLESFNELATRTRPSEGRLSELLSHAITGVRSMQAMLDEIRNYVEHRPESHNPQTTSIDELVKHSVAFCGYDPLARRRRIGLELGSKAMVRADVFRFHQTIINLVRNALQASPDGGEVTVRTAADADRVFVEVENTGDPIPPEVQERLFEPFFTTKGDSGVGLGLSLCRSTVERHRGTLTFSSGPGKKTRFRIQIPRAT